jgi:ABC-type sugar transport system substrate-binding protein
MKKLFLVLGMLITFLFLGCNSGKSGNISAEKTITVGFSFHALLNDIFVGTRDYCVKNGPENTPRVNFIITNADNDVSKQLADVNDLINQKPDVIIVIPIDSATSDTIIKACNDANIPVMIQNRPYNPNGKYKPDTFVGIDAEYQGYIATKDVFDLMIKDGFTELNLLCISGPLTDENSVLRVAGVKKAIEEYKGRGAKFVHELVSNWDLDFTLANLPSAMRANPEVNCLYVASDYLLTAVQTGLESTKQWYPYGDKGHIFIASSDVFPIGLELLKAGYIDTDSLLDAVNMNKAVLDYSVKLANGEKPPEIYVQGPDFTRDNCDSEEMKALIW